MTKKGIPQKVDFFEKLPSSRQHAIALLILFLIPFFLFTATTIGGKRFLAGDSIQWRAMAQSGIEYSEKNDGAPALWTNDMFGGMPTYTISSIKSVPHLDTLLQNTLSTLFPAYWFWVLFLGLYILLVCLRLSPLQAVMGCILFGITTYVPVFIGAGHNSKLIAFAFVPWMLLGYWVTAHSKQKLLGLVAFSVALTLEFRAGHPQITYYFIYLLLFWWLYDTYQAYKQGQTKTWLGTTGILAGATLLGLTASAGHYWRLAEYSSYSIRGGSALDAGSTGLDSGYAFAWSQGIFESLTLLIPNLFGGASPDYWGDKTFTSGPHYLGAIVLPFLILALMKNRKPIVLILFATGTLALLFSWGENLRFFNQFAFDFIPFFNKFRVPETWLIVTTTCYAIVGMFGLEWFVSYVKEHKPTSLNVLYVPFGVTLAIALLFTLSSSSILSFQKEGEVQQYAQRVAQQSNLDVRNPQVQQRAIQIVNSQLVPARKEKTQADATRYFILVLVITGLSVAFMKNKVSPSLLLFALILVVSYDMISVDKRYINEQALADENIDLEDAIVRSKTTADSFIEQNIQSDEAYEYRALTFLSGSPFSVAVPSYFYPSLGGNNGAKLSIFQDLVEQNGPIFGVAEGINTSILGMLNVKYLAIGGNIQLDGLTPVFNNSGAVVYENAKVLPKAFFVDSLIIADTPVDAYNQLKSPSFNPAHTAIVEQGSTAQTSVDSTSNVEVITYDNHTIELKVNRSKPGFMVLSEMYYPKGWIATVNGEEVPIYKTNYALRGIQIPVGAHNVSFNFAPQSYTLGSSIEWGSNIIQWALAGFVLFTFFTKRKEETEDEA